MRRNNNYSQVDHPQHIRPNINDNNHNRITAPSNIIPNINFVNPNDNFNSITTNSVFSNQQYNFNKSFVPNRSVIGPMDYTNKNNTLHNNLEPIILDEHIVEYRLYIDSLDRDINVYPDPFSFKVTFNPTSTTPNPVIGRNFRNVKFIKLENIILPKYIHNKTDEDGNVVIDKSYSLFAERFVYMHIKELNNDRAYTTFDNHLRTCDNNCATYKLPKPFSVIIPDKFLIDHYSGVPCYGTYIFKDSTLGNIDSLTIEFFDSCGKKLMLTDMFPPSEVTKAICDCDPISLSDPRHPLNIHKQVFFTLLIGVTEAQINNVTKFEQN